MKPKTAFFFALILALIIVPGISAAYVGPGAGLSAIGTVLALIGAILLGVIGFVWYPIKRLMRGKRGDEAQDCEDVNNVSAKTEQADTTPNDQANGV